MLNCVNLAAALSINMNIDIFALVNLSNTSSQLPKCRQILNFNSFNTAIFFFSFLILDKQVRFLVGVLSNKMPDYYRGSLFFL